jgi:hypothetical protein
LKRKKIFYISFWPWNNIKQLPQHMALELAKDSDIYYFQPKRFSLNFKSFFELLFFFKIKPINVSKNINVYSFPFFPAWKFNLLRRLNHWMWFVRARIIFRKNLFNSDSLMWISSPEQEDFLKYAKNHKAKIVYHCFDPYEEFYAKIAQMEPEVFRLSDYVIVTANSLYEKAVKYNNNVEIIRNGCEVEHFSNAINGSLSKPEDLPKEGKIIGYIGTIGPWIDWDAIEDVYRLTNTPIVLIGPIEDKYAYYLEKKGSVKILGVKDYSVLPSYLAYFHVALIPFKINSLTIAVNPVKVYEYLASGVRVVATPLPELEEAKELIYIAESKDYSIAVSNLMLSCDLSKKVQEELSKKCISYSWESRGLSARRIVNNLYK